VRILLKTLWVMVARQGVSLDGHATTRRFDEERRDPGSSDSRSGDDRED